MLRHMFQGEERVEGDKHSSVVARLAALTLEQLPKRLRFDFANSRLTGC
jgi:hypothetical protein